MLKRISFRPVLCFFLAVLLVFGGALDAEAKKRTRVKKRSAPVAASSGVNDPRYAALIMNPATGEVYHSQAADEKRYPASLTKMMTLYLLFEALERREVRLSTDMPVSELAARQPQTNLSLDAGDSIEVETAIKALVVRSANDVSVVVAEALGGTVENFARLMTEKARVLGMRGTVFKNPNGLPNSNQYTTARDMAKLGIALKRDFPQYYPYFSTLQFSHNGVTYYTHNRVMLRYAGADGIKTGFIGVSGFNLVTSVTRGGRPLIGVVMGGSSGAWRDNRMIALLDEAYGVIASRGSVRGKASPKNLPLAPKLPKITKEKQEGEANAPVEDAALDQAMIVPPSQAEDGGASDSLPPVHIAPAEKAPSALVAAPSPFDVATSHPSRAKVVQVSKEPVQLANPPSHARDWGIQVGAFSTEDLANQAARAAQKVAPQQLGQALVVTMPTSSEMGAVHRARLENLGQVDARKACEALIANKSPCFIYQVSP